MLLKLEITAQTSNSTW